VVDAVTRHLGQLTNDTSRTLVYTNIDTYQKLETAVLAICKKFS